MKVASGEARYEISETRLSLITVCFNSLGGLATSHESLSAQGKGPWEWVVVDGGSKDGSLAWLQAQRPAVLVSEPDAGIYDAMNKGARLARGEYVYFLNAGDRFADARVLADVVERLRAQPELGLLYGNAVYVDPDGRRQTQRYQHLTPANLLFGNLCHQAVFARRALFEQLGGFDLQYPVAADLDWLARVFRSGVPRACLDRDICLFATGGMHMRRLDQLQTDKRRMQAALMGRSARAWGQFRYRLERRIRRWRGE